MTERLAIDYPLDAEAATRLVRAAVAADALLPEPRLVGGAAVYFASEPWDTLSEPCVCTIGAFDGVHSGHRYLVADAVSDARERGVRTVVVTFDPDPMDLIAPGRPSTRLLSCADRIRMLLACPGVDAVVAFPFVDSLRHTTCGDFLLKTLRGPIRPVAVHVGSDFRMGDDHGVGNVSEMRELGAENDIDVHGIVLLGSEGAPLSATRIRRLLGAGELGQANGLLGRCHYVRGRVERGRGEGTGFGFPTANVVLDVSDCLPQEGVYAGYLVHDGQAWPSAINVGAPPTFSDPRPAFLEANLIGFEGDLYDSEVMVVFVRRLRPSKRFDSLAELERAVFGNIDWVRDNLGSGCVEV